MAAKTQSEVVDEIREKLNSLNSRRFTFKSIAGWVNEGLRDLARRSEGLRASSTIAISAGSKIVTAPATAVRIHTVTYIPDSSLSRYELIYIDPKNAASIMWQDSTTGRPQYFWTWGYPPNMTVECYPIPSETGTLVVQYYTNPAPLATDESAAGTSLTCPQGWEDAIVDYAVYQAMLSDKDDRWQVYKQEYEAKLTAYTDAAIRYVDQSGSIQVGSYLVPQWLYEED